MLIDTDNLVKLNAVLWQPSYSCRDDCCNRKCYVKNGIVSELQLTKEEISYNVDAVIDLIFNEQKLQTNQLTISVDKNSREAIKLALINRWKVPETEIHLTASSAKYLRKYIKLPLCGADLLTISMNALLPSSIVEQAFDILELGLGKPFQPKLALNIIISQDTFSRKGMEQLAYIIRQKIIKPLHIYFLVQKNPLNGPSIKNNIYDFFNFIDESKDVLRFLKALGVKTYLDHCIKVPLDNIIFDKNYVCSAGVDRVHIWPTLHLTGCPYDSKAKVFKNTIPTKEHLLDQTKSILHRADIETYNSYGSGSYKYRLMIHRFGCSIPQDILSDPYNSKKYLSEFRSLFNG